MMAAAKMALGLDRNRVKRQIGAAASLQQRPLLMDEAGQAV
jgi:hypothetical protein